MKLRNFTAPETGKQYAQFSITEETIDALIYNTTDITHHHQLFRIFIILPEFTENNML